MKENCLLLLSNETLDFYFPGNSNDQIVEVGSLLLREWVYTTQFTVVLMGRFQQDQNNYFCFLFLCSFIFERVQRRGESNAVVTRAQLGGGELCDPNHKKLANYLQKIGDELDSNMELQRWSILNLNCCSVKCELEGTAVLVAYLNCDCCFLQDDKWFCTQTHKGHVYEGCSWDLFRWKVQLGQGCCTILLCLSPCHQSELMNFVVRFKQHLLYALNNICVLTLE